jgi:hypothetical protein
MKTLMVLAVLSLSLTGVARAGDPVTCFENANGRNMTIDQRIRLCSGASSNEPITCYDNANGNARYLTIEQKIELCKASSR